MKRIDQCKLYDNKSSINVCLECEAGFFIQGNVCIKRVIAIQFCKVYEKRADLCNSCDVNYVLTDDKLKCLPVIANCGVYEISSQANSAMICKQCAPKYYLEGGNCILGNLANCVFYASATVCLTCDNGYYWGVNGTSAIACNQHTKIDGCLNYSNTVANQCDLCDNVSALLVPLNKCEPVTTKIAQCITYTSVTECGQCKDGYFLSDPATCSPIPDDQNCLRKIGSQAPCVLCKLGFILKAGLCIKPLDYQINMCQNWSSDSAQEEIVCQQCKRYAIFIKGGSNYGHCITPVERLRVFTVTAAIPNCEHQSLDNIGGTVVKCLRCKEGFKIA